MSSRATEHELAQLLLYLHRHRYLTASESLAYLYLSLRANRNGRTTVDFTDMAAALARKKPETCRAYTRRLARLGLLSGTWQRGSWQAEIQLELPQSVIAPVTGTEFNRPLMRNQHPISNTLDPTASTICEGSVE